MSALRKRIYLDYAASTPVDARVREAMEPYWSEAFANPLSVHSDGIRAREAVAQARARVAACLGARETHIVFTSGATEANALAIRGFFDQLGNVHDSSKGVRAVTSLIEHASVLDVFNTLAPRGLRVDRAGVTEQGVVSPELLREVLFPETTFISIHTANSELGTVQPVRQLAREMTRVSPAGVFHTDASQAALWTDLRSVVDGVDLMTLDSQKIYGPKGVGILYVKERDLIAPLFGGVKELRPGTPNVPGIVGCAVALEIACREREALAENVIELRKYLEHEILTTIPGSVLNSTADDRLPHIVNVSFPGVESQFLAARLDEAGVASATKSACLSETGEGSYVVRAIAPDEAWRAESAIRFSLGRETTREELRQTLQILTKLV